MTNNLTTINTQSIMKQSDSKSDNVLVKKYRDVIGRIVSVWRNKETKKYTIESKLYDRNLNAVSFLSISFPTRKDCFSALSRYPRMRNNKNN